MNEHNNTVRATARTCERARYRRKHVTIFISTCTGALAWFMWDVVKGLLLGGVVAIILLYHYTRQIDVYRYLFTLGGQPDE